MPVALRLSLLSSHRTPSRLQTFCRNGSAWTLEFLAVNCVISQTIQCSSSRNRRHSVVALIPN